MKHVFVMLAAALIALPTFAEQKKPQQTPAATTVKSSKSNSSDRIAGGGEGAGQTGQQQQDTGRKMRGRVLSQQGRMFTVTSDGKEFTISGAKLRELPKVGEIVEITFTQTPGGPLEATTVKSSKSNSSERAKSSPSPPAGR